MYKCFFQTRAVFIKCLNLQMRKSKIILNLSIPVVCGLFLWLALLENFEGLTRLQTFVMPFGVCGAIRSFMISIVNEKKERQKEHQLIMGLNISSYYLGFILACLFWTIVCSSFYVFMIFGYDYFIHANYPIYEYIFFYIQYMCYGFAIIGQMLAISSLFTDGRKASDVYAMIFMIISFFYSFTDSDKSDSSTTFILSIFPQNLLTYYWWQEMFVQEGGISMFYTWKIFIIQGFLGILFYIYLDQVIPTKQGTHKSVCFCLNFFRKKKQNLLEFVDAEYELQQQQLNLNAELLNTQEQVESQDASENAFIKITHLTKQYNGQDVVNHLNLNVYKDQIFCLLGHNGAGKSTTVNMICGLVEKDSGKIMINSLDIEKQLDEIRQIIGFCSQEDVIYPEMTVYDHLKYYGQIKLIQQVELSGHVEYLLDLCQLQQEKHQLGMYLSGGGKRKLSLAIALMGNSKVLLLDEPTTGLDPISRQQVWNILREVKKNRCIILTTHFLDEAQELADKVGIIQSGKMTVYGTVDYIKRQFSVGYNISLECINEEHQIEILNQIQPQINALCQQQLNYISQNKLIRINIPLGNDKQISSVLEYLETLQQVNLIFEMTTLEDAYIKIHSDSETHPLNLDENINFKEMFEDVSPALNYRQLKGLIKRRIWIAKQNKWQYLLYLGVWALLIGIFIRFAGEQYIQPRLILTLYIIIKMMFVCQQAYYPIFEKQQFIKQSLITHGGKVYLYWISNFIFDGIVIIFEQVIFLLLIIIASYIDETKEYHNYNLFVYLKFIVVNIVFSIGLNCQLYLATHFYQSTYASNVQLPIFTFLYEWLFLMIYAYFETNQKLIGFEEFIFEMAIPLLPLFQGYHLISRETDLGSEDFGVSLLSLLWSQFPAILSSLLFFLLINYLDYRKFKLPNHYSNEISVNSISQKFGDRTILDNVSFNLGRKQVFGLLGPNGAGKTSTFNIMTRLVKPVSGNVSIKNEDTQVGLVPSISPVYEDLTFKQHLILYGLIKGLDENQIEIFNRNFCQIMNVEKIYNQKTKYLSGGERRKLQLGIALIGGSSKLLMDEPTSGIDAVSRRKFQQLIVKNCHINHSSIVLTTHSMSEAEKTCDVLGIMINGQLKFVGTLSGLRSHYHNKVQFSLGLKNKDDKEIVRQLVQNKFNNNIEEINEYRANFITFLVKNEFVKLSEIFRFLQSQQIESYIEDFEIQHATLDQIFKYYVQQQIINQPQQPQIQIYRGGFLSSICE